IRDLIVTGVQTCALPISGLPAGPVPLVIALHGLGQTIDSLQEWLHLDAAAEREHFVVVYPQAYGKWSYGRPIGAPMPQVNGKTRSEERRVGKECRDRGQR